jgi:hypothetical protein
MQKQHTNVLSRAQGVADHQALIHDATGRTEFNLHVGLMGVQNQGSFTGSIGDQSYLSSVGNIMEMHSVSPPRSYAPSLNANTVTSRHYQDNLAYD